MRRVMILLAALLLVLVAAVPTAAASDRVERVRFMGRLEQLLGMD